VFIISNIIASILSFFSTEINTLEQLGRQLVDSVEIVKEEYEKGNIPLGSIEKLFKDKYINISFIENMEEYAVEEEKMAILETGKTITLHINGNRTITMRIVE